MNRNDHRASLPEREHRQRDLSHCRRTQRVEGRRAGTTTVELALVLPVLFLIVFGSVEFSRLNMLKHLANVAAYEGARCGMCIGATSSDVTASAVSILNAGGVVNPTITVTPATITQDTDQIQVDIAIPVAGNFWLAPTYSATNVTGRCTLKTERLSG